jgi:predicted amidohydrolase YtcJ
VSAGQGDDLFRINGAGEMLVYSAADFEDFLEPRPDMAERMEQELTGVVRLLAEKRWPFRLHATYDETISRALDVFEAVNREVPLKGLHWMFDHAETITQRNIDRIRALEGGIAVQHRMAFQGEYFLDRYGAEKAGHAPPIRRMLQTGIPVGGAQIYSGDNRMSREEALRLWTHGSAWFSNEQASKGTLEPGKVADLAVLSADYFSVAEERIKSLESVLTLLGGRPVYAAAEFADLAPPPLPVEPKWSPVAHYGGYHKQPSGAALVQHSRGHVHAADAQGAGQHLDWWGPGACPCWAF